MDSDFLLCFFFFENWKFWLYLLGLPWMLYYPKLTLKDAIPTQVQRTMINSVFDIVNFFHFLVFFNSSIIALQCCISFCYITAWISYVLSCSVMSNSFDCSLPGSSVHGILQARTLEWVVMPSSGESSHPRDWTQVSLIAGRFFTTWATREAQEYWSG